MAKKFNRRLKGDGKITVDTIAKKLLEATDRIIDYKIALALGMEKDIPENFELGLSDVQNEILDKTEPLLKAYRETKTIEAGNTEAIVAMLKSGTITPAEAITLIKLLQAKIKTDEMEMELDLKKKLIDQVEEEEDEISGENDD